jgi:transcriptional regulator with XRE-family HTH domain
MPYMQSRRARDIAERVSAVLAERLQETMMQRGLSQVGAAGLAEVSPNTLLGWLNGTRLPRVPQLMMLARGLGVSPEWLVGYDLRVDED